MNTGLADQYVYQMLMDDQQAHAAWITAHAWQHPAPPRRRWRHVIASQLIALAGWLAPAATLPDTNEPVPTQ